MAGITQEKILYLNVTKGRMIHKTKEKGITHDFNGYEGHFLGIRERISDYEGKPQTKVELKMKDTGSDEIVIIQFTKKAWAAHGLLASIGKVDLSKPFTVKVWGSDENEKMSFCGLQQQGYKYIENRKCIDPDKSFPKPIAVTISGEKTWDWTAVFTATDAVIKSITEKTQALAPAVETTEIEEEAETWANPDVSPMPNTTDDLPF